MAHVLNKLKYSAYSAVVFLVVSSPAAYKLTQKLLGGIVDVASLPSGTPTSLGLSLHATVFLLIMFWLMHLPL